MNNVELRKFLNDNKFTKKYFIGVFPENLLPQKIKRTPCLLIANTDPASKPGEHWVAIYITKNGHAEYFDSFGFAPMKKNILLFLRNNSKTYKFNPVKIQSLFSNQCGKFCAVYLYYKSKGKSLKYVLSFFNKNYNENEIKISKLFNQIYCSRLSKNKKNINCIQTSKPHMKYNDYIKKYPFFVLILNFC